MEGSTNNRWNPARVFSKRERETTLLVRISRSKIGVYIRERLSRSIDRSIERRSSTNPSIRDRLDEGCQTRGNEMSRLPAKRINIGLEWCTVNSAVTASRDGTYLVYATTDNPYDRNDNKINHTFMNLIESFYKYRYLRYLPTINDTNAIGDRLARLENSTIKVVIKSIENEYIY